MHDKSAPPYINAAEGLHGVLKTNLGPKGIVRMYMDSRLGKEPFKKKKKNFNLGKERGGREWFFPF
jgi:hypothetical protein